LVKSCFLIDFFFWGGEDVRSNHATYVSNINMEELQANWYHNATKFVVL
jgi:hypothetical protein